MSRVLITGSTLGLGLLSARQLWADGHDVVLHARTDHRAADIRATVDRGDIEIVVGDLSDLHQVRDLAQQIRHIDPLDAIIHNAGLKTADERPSHADGTSEVFTVNVLAPYLITALAPLPERLVFLSSNRHKDGRSEPADAFRAHRRGSDPYSESKFHVTALAMAIARRRPDVHANAVDPGWVPTRMGGTTAPDDLALGAATQAWLATSHDPAAMVTGTYFHHQQAHEPHPATTSAELQDQLLAVCHQLTGVPLTATP